ncbi:MAG: hypothetical protein HY017_16115 [Betaproteobacteria bacterium]|nr:hypothetical protein [Betaproteobacteria bacterium]
MTWDHVKFLALLIPTWLLIGAAALTLKMASNDGDRAPARVSEGRLYAQVPDSRALGGPAAQYPEQEPVPEWE